MKSIRFLWYVNVALVVAASILLSACSTSNDVVSSNIIQKRKHRNGYHLNLGSQKSPNNLSQRIPALVDQPDANQNGTPETRKAEQTQVSEGHNEGRTYSKFAATKRVLSDLTKASIKKGPRQQTISWFKPRSGSALSESDDVSRGTLESALPEEDEEVDEQTQRYANIALIAGVLTWVFLLFAIVTNFIVPGLGIVFSLLALVLAIMAVVFGNRSKKESDLGLVGFILGLIYLILVAVVILLSIVLIIAFIAVFSL
ncbi:MAG: hypothetical protein HQ500_08045 [Flavobacteriales bacterium]|nr:hypothetical protein [Flavobacteriales bacterium]